MRLSSAQRNILKDKGREYYALRMYDKALASFTKLVEDEPVAAVLDLRAATLEKLGKLDAALQDGMAMIRLQKSLDRGYLRCGSILMKMNKPHKAIQVYESGVRRCRDAQVSTMTLEASLKLARSNTVDDNGVDFIAKQSLPVEILEMVVQYLSLKDQCNCLRVSRAWNESLRGSWRIWADLDFSSATNNVPLKSAEIYASYAGGRTRRLVIWKMLLQGNKAFSHLMRKCSQLQELQLLSGGYLHQTLTDGIRFTPRLTRFEASSKVPMTLSAVHSILRRCPQLEALLVSSLDVDIHNVTWDANDAFPNLRSCKMWVTGMTGSRSSQDMLAFFPPAYNLRALSFRISGAPAADLTALIGTKLTDLESLDLSGVRLALDDTTGKLNLPAQLKSLSLHNCHFQALAVGALETASPLTRLQLLSWQSQQNSQLHVPDTINNLIQHSTVLQSLTIGAHFSWPLEALHLLTSLESLHTLRVLSITAAGGLVTDASLRESLKPCTQLEQIDVSGSHITGVGVRQLVSSLPRLSLLKINDCSGISADAIGWAREQGVKVVHQNSA